jgi:uncharacterized membrane protein YccC
LELRRCNFLLPRFSRDILLHSRHNPENAPIRFKKKKLTSLHHMSQNTPSQSEATQPLPNNTIMYAEARAEAREARKREKRQAAAQSIKAAHLQDKQKAKEKAVAKKLKQTAILPLPLMPNDVAFACLHRLHKRSPCRCQSG